MCALTSVKGMADTTHVRSGINNTCGDDDGCETSLMQKPTANDRQAGNDGSLLIQKTGGDGDDVDYWDATGCSLSRIQTPFTLEYVSDCESWTAYFINGTSMQGYPSCTSSFSTLQAQDEEKVSRGADSRKLLASRQVAEAREDLGKKRRRRVNPPTFRECKKAMSSAWGGDDDSCSLDVWECGKLAC